MLKSEYEFKSSELVERFTQDYEGLYNQSRKEFEAYCILNRKVHLKKCRFRKRAMRFRILLLFSTPKTIRRPFSQLGSNILTKTNISEKWSKGLKSTTRQEPRECV